MGVLTLAGLVVLVLLAAWAYMIPMPGTPHEGPLPPSTPEQEMLRERLEGHVRVLAEEIGERNHLFPEALAEAAAYVQGELEDAGYRVRLQSYEAYGQEFWNVEAAREGAERPQEIFVVGAHYDSVPGSPGANDNGSGIAALLELARILGDRTPARTLRFVAFTNEEPPHFQTPAMGSRVYARRAAEGEEEIVGMISLETIGYYRDEPGTQHYPFPFGLFYPDEGDFIAFVGDLRSRSLVRGAVGTFRSETAFPAYGVAAPRWIPGIGWSDHDSFWRHGYRALMITDTAPFRYPHYHTEDDRPPHLDYGRMARVVDGVRAVVKEEVGIE